MRYTVRLANFVLGAVDLPLGPLVAARLEPAPAYGSIAATVRNASVESGEVGRRGG
jgi:hypothetical protein